MKRILTAAALVAMASMAAAPTLAATTAAPKTTTTSTKMATATPATTTPAKPAVVTFKAIDANHDGKISYDELKKYFPKLTKADFAKYDTKKLGYYDHAELAAFAKAMQPTKTGKM